MQDAPSGGGRRPQAPPPRRSTSARHRPRTNREQWLAISRPNGRSAKIDVSRAFVRRGVFPLDGRLAHVSLERLSPTRPIRQQSREFPALIEAGRRPVPGLPADLRHRRPVLALLHHERLPRVRKPRCLHGLRSPPSQGDRSGKLQPSAIRFSGGGALAALARAAAGFRIASGRNCVPPLRCDSTRRAWRAALRAWCDDRTRLFRPAFRVRRRSPRGGFGGVADPS